jgi:hypothetical protein
MRSVIMPLTVASPERIFSKLKLPKNYLRSKISQERQNILATLYIEKILVHKIDIDVIIMNSHQDMLEENIKITIYYTFSYLR